MLARSTRAALLALAARSGALTAQDGTTPPATDILMTVSGGVSMGAYQGGFNWALIAHMRRDPSLRLIGAGGASAGNINSLLSVLEYCQGRQTSPTESLFWKVWVRTGLEDLLPPFDETTARARRDEVRSQLATLFPGATNPAAAWDDESDGVFSREFYHARQLPVLAEVLAQQEWSRCAGREIPVGITLTSLTPRRVALDDQEQLWASTVRVASGFSVRFDQTATFVQLAPEMRQARGIGVLLALPSDTAGRISTIDVFKLLEGSSAFPVAFGPRALRFYDPAVLGSDGSCPQNVRGTCNVPERELFIDGGVFDNNPVDLIWSMTHPRPRALEAPTRLIYLDPDTYRRPLEGTRIAIGKPSATGGIAALMQLAESAVPAARQYELQALHRIIRRYDPGIGESLRITNRALPIYGDHLGAFAAFFGRPLRSHDFYVGVYDALVFVATEFICREAPAGVAQRSCIADRVRSEIEARYGFPIDPTGQLLLRTMFGAEFGDAARLPGLTVDGTAEDSVLLDLLVQDLALLEGRSDQGCAQLAPVHAALCATGMEQAIRGLSPRTRETVRQWAGDASCQASRGFLDPACRAEPSFARLLEDPGGFAEQLTEDVLERVRLVEHRRGREPQPHSERQVELAQMAYRATADRYKRMSLELDPSTIPDRDRSVPAWLLHYLMPYYFVGALVDNGNEFGWRPRLHLGPPWALDGLLGVHLWPGWTPQVALGIGPSLKAAPWATLNASLVRTSPARIWQGHKAQWGLDASIRVLTDKLSVSVRWLPGNSSQMFEGDEIGYFVGLSDLNGLLYMLGSSLF